MNCYEFFKVDLENQGMTLIFEDSNRNWIHSFFKQWIDIATLYFIHKQKKAVPFICFASRYTHIDELLDDLEKFDEDTYMLNIAAFLCVALVRMAHAANRNEPWDVAFYAAQIPEILYFLPAWRGLQEAHLQGFPIEEAKLVNEEQRVKSTIAKQNAAKRHEKNNALKKHAIEFYEKNKNQFPSRAAAAKAIMKFTEVEFRTIDGWLKDHIRQQSASRQ